MRNLPPQERFRRAILEAEEALLEQRANIEAKERALAAEKSATVDAEIKLARLVGRARIATRKRHIQSSELHGPIPFIRDGYGKRVEPAPMYPPEPKELKNGYRDPFETPTEETVSENGVSG